MADDQVDVNLRFTATDETGRITQDMVRQAQEGTRAIVAAYETRARVIESMAKRAGVTTEAMAKRIEEANKKTGISFEEMGKKMSAMVADQLQKQQMLGQVTDRTTVAIQRQAQTYGRDMVQGMSAMGRASNESARATERMTKGMTDAGRASRTASEGIRQSTSAVESSISVLGRYASAAYLAQKAFQLATSSYTGFAERQRGAFRVAEDWQLSAEEAAEYEKVQDRIFRTTGQNYAQQDAAARKWGATEKSVGMERLKIWEQTQVAAHVLGVTVDQAGRLGQLAIRDMGVEAKDLPNQFAGMKSVPSAMIDPIINGLEKLTPKLKSSGVDVAKIGPQIVSGMKGAAPELATMDEGVEAYTKTILDALNPTTVLGMNLETTANKFKAGQITIHEFYEAIYQEAKRQDAYAKGGGGVKEFARDYIQKSDKELELLEKVHEKRKKSVEDAQREELESRKRFLDAKAKLDADAQSVADKVEADIARAKSKTGETVHGAGAQRAGEIALPTPDDVVEGLRQPGFWPWNRPKPKPQPRARGGPVDKDKPYLTGEEGPEIIVPQTSGQVLSAAESQRYGDILGKSQAEADMAMRNYFAQFRDKGRPMKKLSMLDKPAEGPREGTGAGAGSGMGGAGPPGGGGGGDGDGKTPPTTPDTGGPPAGPPTSGPGYNIGPYGQPMPAWGTHVTEGEDWGGGTGGGVAGGVPGLPGGPSGRALTKEERAAGGAAPAGTGTGGGGGGGLAAIRAKFAEELKNDPATRRKLLDVAAAEDDTPAGRQAFIESAMNAAAAHGRTMKSILNDNKFFPPRTLNYKGRFASDDPTRNAEVNTVLGGSDLIKGGTGNYSTSKKRGWVAGLPPGTLAPGLGGGAVTYVNPANKETYGFDKGRNAQEVSAWEKRYQEALRGGGAAPPVGTGDMAKPAGAVLASPLTGTVISTLGDERKAYKGRSAGTHQGIDIAAPQGTPISAQLGGTVIRGPYTSKSAAGQAIVVRYDDGTEARIYHLSKFGAFDAAKNKTFKAGDVLGYVGKTGAGGEPLPGNTPPHAHIEYYDKTGKRLDPSQVLGIGKGGEGKQKQLVSGVVYGQQPGPQTKVAGPATAAPVVPAAPAVPAFVPGRTQGLPGTPSGPAVKRDRPTTPDVTPTPTPDTAAPAITKGQAAAGDTAAPTSKATTVSAGDDEGLAEGGTATAGHEYWVGEEGPEKIKMGGQSAKVTDAQRARQALKELRAEQQSDEWEIRKQRALGPPGQGHEEWSNRIPKYGEVSRADALRHEQWGMEAQQKKTDAWREHKGPEGYEPDTGGQIGGYNPQTGRPLGTQIKYQDLVIRPRIEHLGGHSAQWQHRAERSRQTDISRRAAREAHTDAGFA